MRRRQLELAPHPVSAHLCNCGQVVGSHPPPRWHLIPAGLKVNPLQPPSPVDSSWWHLVHDDLASQLLDDPHVLHAPKCRRPFSQGWSALGELADRQLSLGGRRGFLGNDSTPFVVVIHGIPQFLLEHERVVAAKVVQNGTSRHIAYLLLELVVAQRCLPKTIYRHFFANAKNVHPFLAWHRAMLV